LKVSSVENEDLLYSTRPVRVPRPSRKHVHKPRKFRASLSPGTVVILLAGRHRGKRVVLLHKLEKSGMIVVCGPFSLNGVPLRRVNPSYVVATSTKVDVSTLDVSKYDDSYFERKGGEITMEVEDADGEAKKAAYKPSESRISDQKELDAAILAKVESNPVLKSYLGARFSLSKGQAPHMMKF